MIFIIVYQQKWIINNIWATIIFSSTYQNYTTQTTLSLSLSLMALASSSSRILSNRKLWSDTSSPSWSHRPRTSPFTVSANPKKLSSSSKTGRFDSKNRRSTPVITKEDDTFQGNGTADIDATATASPAVGDGFVMPDLPGDKPNFWEGPQWDAFGFFVQYMWAFGVVFAVTFLLLS